MLRGLRAVAGSLAFGAGLVVASPAFAERATYQAHHRPAAELAGLVGFSFRGVVAFAADEKTNQVLVDGGAAAVAQARVRLAELDRAPVPLSVELVVTSDGKAVWRGKVAVLSGVTARVELGGVREIALPAGGTLTALKARVTATVVKDGVDVRAHAEVSLDGAAGARTVRLTGSARAAAGQARDVARVELAAGRVLALGLLVTPASPASR